jgi:Tfp pilus assembly protein PilF
MRKLLGKAMVAALVIGLVPYAFAAADQEQVQRDIRSMTINELEKAGDARRAVQDYAGAIFYFQEAIRRDNRNELIYNKLGLSQMLRGDNNAARRAFERAIRLRPDYANALNNLGVVHFRQNRMVSAERYFRRAIAAEVTRAAFYVNLGVTLFNQNRIEYAMQQYTRAIELDPEILWRSSSLGITAQISNPYDRGRFYFVLARVLAYLGADEDCLRCLELARNSGYRGLRAVYSDDMFSRLWDDARLHEIVAPPTSK